MPEISVERVQVGLREVISQLQPSEELVIVDNGQPVAKLTRAPRTNWPCKAGSAKHRPIWIAPDFDAPLDEFREYME